MYSTLKLQQSVLGTYELAPFGVKGSIESATSIPVIKCKSSEQQVLRIASPLKQVLGHGYVRLSATSARTLHLTVLKEQLQPR